MDRVERMNERIRELAEESGAGWDDKYHWYVGNEQLKKFAELIVRECLDVLNPDNDHLTSMREEYGRKMSIRLIEQHFGIDL